jgi:lariat debranching enzyme
MKIAVEGCAHGELDKIYEAIRYLEKKDGITVDLLICCGDFQSTRNMEDLSCMAVPRKFREICTFYK